jgi:hypothetical protein
MKYVVSIIFVTHFFVSANTYCQGVPKFINERINELRESKIDTIVTFSPCFGWLDPITPKPQVPQYILWVDNNHLYLQKYFHRTSDYAFFASEPFLMESDTLKKFLLDNLYDMMFEKLLPAVFKFSYDSIEYYQPMEFRHECIDYLVFFIQEDIRRKEFSYRAVYRDSITRNQSFANLNYKFNQSLSITKLVEKIKAAFDQAEKNMIFYKKE